MMLPSETVRAMIGARVACLDEAGRAMFARQVADVSAELRTVNDTQLAGLLGGHLLALYSFLVAPGADKNIPALAMTVAVFATALHEAYGEK
jgi:hypothetical protein